MFRSDNCFTLIGTGYRPRMQRFVTSRLRRQMAPYSFHRRIHVGATGDQPGPRHRPGPIQATLLPAGGVMAGNLITDNGLLQKADRPCGKAANALFGASPASASAPARSSLTQILSPR